MPRSSSPCACLLPRLLVRPIRQRPPGIQGIDVIRALQPEHKLAKVLCFCAYKLYVFLLPCQEQSEHWPSIWIRAFQVCGSWQTQELDQYFKDKVRKIKCDVQDYCNMICTVRLMDQLF